MWHDFRSKMKADESNDIFLFRPRHAILPLTSIDDRCKEATLLRELARVRDSINEESNSDLMEYSARVPNAPLSSLHPLSLKNI